MKETPEEYAARKEREREEWEERERDREHARAEKRRLISRAESISSTNDFKAGSEAMRELSDEWQNSGYAGRDYEQELRSDFKAARQRFYDRRQAHFEQKERERDKVAAAKRRIINQAQAISRSTDFKAGHEALSQLRAAWKDAGRAGKDTEEELYAEFRQAQETFYERSNAAREARGREREQNRAKKASIVSRAQALASRTDFKAAAEDFDELQNEWRSIKSAGRAEDEELWNAFNSAKQRFHTAKKQHFDSRNREFAQRGDKKRQIISKGNALLSMSDGKAARAQFVELRKEWGKIGSAGRDEAALWQEFSAIGDTLFSKRLFQDPANAMQRLKKQIDQQFSKRLTGDVGDVERENRRATTWLTGGHRQIGAASGRTEKHHSDPMEYGGAKKQKLTPMERERHRAFHHDDRAWRETKDWKKDTPRERKVEIRADHYDLAKNKYPDAARDFFSQHPEQEVAAERRSKNATQFVRDFKPKKND